MICSGGFFRASASASDELFRTVSGSFKLEANASLSVRSFVKFVYAVLAALTPCAVAAASDYTAGIEAIKRGDFAQARASLERSAERGHALSQAALGKLALMHSDRHPNALQALGWLLAAQDNGGRNLEADIARAREEAGSVPEDGAREYVTKFGSKATRKNWLPDKSDPEYDPCTSDSSRATQAADSQPQPWEHVAVALIDYGRSGRLVDVQSAFRFPADTRYIDDDYWLKQLLARGKSPRNGSECTPPALLVMRSGGPRTNTAAALQSLIQPAKDGDPAALHTLGMVLTIANDQHGLELIKQAAQAGEPAAQFYVAKQLPNPGLARQWLELAASNDVHAAQVEVAELLLMQPNRAENLERAAALIDRASNDEEQYVIARVAAIRAAAPDEMLRDPAAAMRLARKLDLGKFPLPIRYEAAALAYSSAGEFDRAIKLEKEAIQRAGKLAYDTASMKDRLAAFEAGKRWYGYLAAEYR